MFKKKKDPVETRQAKENWIKSLLLEIQDPPKGVDPETGQSLN